LKRVCASKNKSGNGKGYEIENETGHGYFLKSYMAIGIIEN